jgi:uncharacterized protein (TIGR02391 family)
MSWSPDSALKSQAELLVQARTKDVLLARGRIIKECEADANKRGMLRSGSHIGAICERWGALLHEHGTALLADLISLFERFAELTPDSVEWLQSFFTEHIDRLARGSARGLVEYVKRVRIGSPALTEHVERELHRSGDAVKGDGRLRLRMALGEAELRRGEQKSGGNAVTTATAPTRFELEGLHPRVQEVSGALYRDGHYRQAILDAYIALAEEVRKVSGLGGIDNTPLMQKAFSPNKPLLQVGDNADEQQGFTWLYSGAVMAIRNPKAHRLVEQKDPQRALEWLAFASVLFRVLDDARKAE